MTAIVLIGGFVAVGLFIAAAFDYAVKIIKHRKSKYPAGFYHVE
jgi:hypothetical protein